MEHPIYLKKSVSGEHRTKEKHVSGDISTPVIFFRSGIFSIPVFRMVAIKPFMSLTVTGIV